MMDAMAERRFDRFAVRPGRRQLLVDGQPAKVGARAFDVLLALIERRQRVVSKNELLDLVWPGIEVEEGNLHVHIVALRKLLGAGAIATIPGRGYKFAAAIEGLDAPTAVWTRPAAADVAQPASNLPSQLPPPYGRGADVAALKALIARHRLVSIVGPGGIGKTRAAQAVAHDLRGVDRDGAWLVELAPLENPDLAASTVARVLGHRLGPKETALASLIEPMRGQKLLLVLDNCEHLIGAVAELARAILAEAPGVRLLATSQEPLRLAEERVVRLGPLEAPTSADPATALDYGAVALFAARATAADARFALADDNVGAVVDICSRLDGIALAIELAAARVSLLGVQGLRQRLDERLRLLAGGAREALPRHRTLRAALEWSYALLSHDERIVLDRLGVFVGGFSLEAAQKVASDERIDEWAVLDHLSTLVDKSLVMAEAGKPPRYRLLETTRAFALERLAATGATEAMRRRHAQALVSTFRSVGAMQGPSVRMARTAADLDNVRAAAAWATGPAGDRGIAIELVGEIGYLWYITGFHQEGGVLFRAVEPWLDETTAPVVAARFWLSRSVLQIMNAVRRAAEAGLRAADLYRSLGDRESLFLALTNAAQQNVFIGETIAAERALAESRTLLDPAWPAWTRGRLEHVSASSMFWRGQAGEARKGWRTALELYRGDGGDAFYAEQIEWCLMMADLALGHFQDVVRAGRDLLARATAYQGGYMRGQVAAHMGAALAHLGDFAGAEATFRAALPQTKSALGAAFGSLNYVAFLLARQGRLEDAARLIGHVDGSRTAQTVVKSPAQRRAYAEALAIVEPALGASAFERLTAEGRKLTEDEAITIALPQKKRIDRV